MLLERTGYVEINERQRRLDGRTLSVSPGEELKDVRLTMLMTATVFGRVVDEDGDPLAAAEVAVMRKPYGKTQWESVGSERTNDLGEFRIPGLFPGRYFVSASPAPDYQRLASLKPQRRPPEANPTSDGLQLFTLEQPTVAKPLTLICVPATKFL